MAVGDGRGDWGLCLSAVCRSLLSLSASAVLVLVLVLGMQLCSCNGESGGTIVCSHSLTCVRVCMYMRSATEALSRSHSAAIASAISLQYAYIQTMLSRPSPVPRNYSLQQTARQPTAAHRRLSQCKGLQEKETGKINRNQTLLLLPPCAVALCAAASQRRDEGSVGSIARWQADERRVNGQRHGQGTETGERPVGAERAETRFNEVADVTRSTPATTATGDRAVDAHAHELLLHGVHEHDLRRLGHGNSHNQ